MACARSWLCAPQTLSKDCGTPPPPPRSDSPRALTRGLAAGWSASARGSLVTLAAPVAPAAPSATRPDGADPSHTRNRRPCVTARASPSVALHPGQPGLARRDLLICSPEVRASMQILVGRMCSGDRRGHLALLVEGEAKPCEGVISVIARHRNVTSKVPLGKDRAEGKGPRPRERLMHGRRQRTTHPPPRCEDCASAGARHRDDDVDR